MGAEVGILAERAINAGNAIRVSISQAERWREATRSRAYKREYNDLKKSKERMPISEEKEAHGNLYTGKVKRPNDAKKHLLYQTRTVDELHAAEYAWNHPNVLQRVRESVLGETKNTSDPKEIKKLGEKVGRGVKDYKEYKMKYEGRTYVVKTENIGNKYERIYHLHRMK